MFWTVRLVPATLVSAKRKVLAASPKVVEKEIMLSVLKHTSTHSRDVCRMNVTRSRNGRAREARFAPSASASSDRRDARRRSGGSY